MPADRLNFKKTGRAIYLSHLDLLHTFQRAFVRAGIVIKHSEGFNPHPYVSFALPLSVGVASVCELMDFELQGGCSLDELPVTLNSVLPEGINVCGAYRSELKFSKITYLDIEGIAVFDKGIPDGIEIELKNLFARPSLPVLKRSKSGPVEIDIIPLIKSIVFERRGGIAPNFGQQRGQIPPRQIAIRARVCAQNPGLNPELLSTAIHVGGLTSTPDFISYTRNEVLDINCEIFR